MRSFSTTIHILLFLAVLIAPFLFAIKGKRPGPSLAACMALAALLTFLVAWWPRATLNFEIWWLGLDTDGLNMHERTLHVPPDKKAYAETLYWSPQRFGVSPVFQAAIIYVILVAPYAFGVCTALFMIRNAKSKTG